MNAAQTVVTTSISDPSIDIEIATGTAEHVKGCQTVWTDMMLSSSAKVRTCQDHVSKKNCCLEHTKTFIK